MNLKNIGIVTKIVQEKTGNTVEKTICIKLNNSDEEKNYYFFNEKNTYKTIKLEQPISCEFDLKCNVMYEFEISFSSDTTTLQKVTETYDGNY